MKTLDKKIYSAWQTLSREASVDGIVCDIIVGKATSADWNKFISLVRNYSYEYISKGVADSLPQKIDKKFFLIGEIHWLSIRIGSTTVECHFYTHEELELNVVPSTLSKVSEIEQFFAFLTDLGISLQKPIGISLEGTSAKPSIVFSPEDSNFTVRF